VKRSWQRRLRAGDKEMVLRWIAMSSVEQVARVTAALSNPDGERGQPDKLDTLLLLKMAHLVQQKPERSIHDIADQVAKENQPRRNHSALSSLIAKLERDYKANRHTWPRLAESAPEPSQQEIDADLGAEKIDGEWRARARLVEVLPSKGIDLFDMVSAEAKAAGKLALITRLGRKHGRERVERLIVDAVERMKANPYPLKDSRYAGRLPRTMFEMIEPDLKALPGSTT
jgi:hypothetical protein